METCDRNGNCIDDAPTYAQEQLADIEKKEELKKTQKEKQLIAKYKWALSFAACDYSLTKTDCSKCKCKDSCKHKPATLGCRFTLMYKWERDAGIEDNQRARDHRYDDYLPTCAQEQLADVKRREAANEAVDHPSYYKTGGIEAIDVIEAWNLGFCLGNTIKYISRAGRKSDKVLEDLKKAAWYLDREIKKINSKAPYMVK